jgi:hypothetical protein
LRISRKEEDAYMNSNKRWRISLHIEDMEREILKTRSGTYNEK